MDLFKQMALKLALDVLEKLITPELVAKTKAQIVTYLRELAKETDNELDDQLVDIVAKALSTK